MSFDVKLTSDDHHHSQTDFYIVQDELVSTPWTPFYSASFAVHPLHSCRKFPAVPVSCPTRVEHSPTARDSREIKTSLINRSICARRIYANMALCVHPPVMSTCGRDRCTVISRTVYHRDMIFNFSFFPEIYSVRRKSSPLKLFAIFSLRLSLFSWNFADLLPVYIHTGLPILVYLS